MGYRGLIYLLGWCRPTLTLSWQGASMVVVLQYMFWPIPCHERTADLQAGSTFTFLGDSVSQLNALKRISLNLLHFQPLYFGSSSSLLRTTVALCLLLQQREVISLYFSHFTPVAQEEKAHWAFRRFTRSCPGSGLEKWWEDSAPFESVHRGDSA